MSVILDLHGNPFETRALKRRQSDDNLLLRQQWPEHPSVGINVNRLYGILQAAEQGDLTAQADFFCDMEERDGHLFAEMSKRRRALLTLPWKIVPPRNASATEQALAVKVSEWFQDLPDFEALLFDLTDAIGHGFSPVEIDWSRQGKLWFPLRFHKRPQRWFRTPSFAGDDIRLTDGTADGAALWPTGWVLHRHKAKCGGFPEAGLFRVLAWTYLFKNLSARDLAEFLEVYGLPMRVGKYPSGTTDDEKMELMRAVMTLGREAAGIMPQGMEINFEDAAAGQADPFKFMIDWCERTQSKVILGATLTSQTESNGNRSLGDVHNEVRHELLASDARQLATTLTRELLWPLLALNGHADTDPRRMCRFEFDASEPEDLKTLADAIGASVNAGIAVGQEWAHQRTGIPVPAAGETLLVPPGNKRDTPAALSLLSDARAMLPFTQQAALSVQEDNSAQATLDAVPQALAGVTEEAMRALLTPLVAALSDGQPPEALHALIDAAYPQLADEEMRQLIENALFVADLWGRVRG
ncbi:hypothetical protein NG99_04635 [Erwinia typographi]|uniref:Mu-like prophage FluMu protein gp29 n=1 Tax=Erwinia typographi TaxID=371042 RepID=A0A0A4ABW3_9GAMM|nr:DUF935 domain-containing protein [Erwinia typographi]KGT95308.1 hypothetical protein NG99_04635 [Erwinia typographi]